MKNNRRQVAGAILSPDWIVHPKRADATIRQVAEDGYALLDLFVRDMRANVTDPEVRDAVGHIVATAHRFGLRCILDTDHGFWGRSVVERHPEAALLVFIGVETRLREGRFSFRAHYPGMLHPQVVFDRLSAVFVPAGGGYDPVAPTQITWNWQNIGHPRPGFEIQGTIADGRSGPAVGYVACRCYAYPDVAHPRYLAAQRALIDAYREIPLDGFGWDEPGKGPGDLRCFKAGEGFLRLFRRKAGYDLETRLVWLDHGDDTPEAVRVRSDYYRALNDMNDAAQKAHNDYAEKRFGRKLYFGTHQTWCGLPADLAGGVVDYFRLGRSLSAAWSDGSWEVDLKYPAFHFTLADGIRNELGLRDAYYNDWGNTTPAIEDMRFATRYKMLFHVNWFNIFFSDYTESLINWRIEPGRAASQSDIRDLDRFDALLDGLPAHSAVGWVYLWEGAAAAPKWLARAWYTASANLALHLADAGLFASMISPGALRTARVERDAAVVGRQRFRAFVVPYAYALPGEAFDKLMQLAQRGFPVLFFGPPPSFTPDGASIREAFARRAGIAPFTLADYQQAFAAQGGLPDVAEWEPDQIDFLYPVAVADGIATRNAEGEITHVRGKDAPVYFLAGADPREDIVRLLLELTGPPLDVFADHAYCRCFGDPTRPGRQVVLTVAHGRIADAQLVPSRLQGMTGRTRRKRISPRALVRLAGGELIVRGGTWCAVAFEDGRPVGAVGDAEAVSWNGEPVELRAADAASPAGR